MKHYSIYLTYSVTSFGDFMLKHFFLSDGTLQHSFNIHCNIIRRFANIWTTDAEHYPTNFRTQFHACSVFVLLHSGSHVKKMWSQGKDHAQSNKSHPASSKFGWLHFICFLCMHIINSSTVISAASVHIQYKPNASVASTKNQYIHY